MNKEEFRNEYKNLLMPKNLDEYLSILDLYANFLLNMGFNCNGFPLNKFYAGTMLQMFACKNISLQQMMRGISYKTDENLRLNNILDPTTIIPHARTIYELLCTFELVFILPDNEEKKLILHNLWCIAGLMNRQNFYSETLTEEQKQQCIGEKNDIELYIQKIEASPIYNLGKNKKIIDGQIKQKKCQIIIGSDNKVRAYGLKEIPSFFGMNRMGLFKEVYNFFSMYAHSSYISILQFEGMFKNRDDVSIMSYILKNVVTMYSVFISDYIQLFPNTKEYFLKQDVRTQMILRMYARFIIRGASVDIDIYWQEKLE